jgi:hypothetical protein
VPPSPRESLRNRRRRSACSLTLLLVALVVALQLQRGAAEVHHNYDAPLTVEAPWTLLPSDLALCAYPALVADPLASSLAWLRLAAGITGRLGRDPGPAATGPASRAPDAPRAPPLRSLAPSS